jgi:FkbM family methyltransferase
MITATRLTSPLLSRLMQFLPPSAKRAMKDRLGVPSVESTLLRMQRSGFRAYFAIDVGAYAGEWTTLCKAVFPEARVLMIEPQAARQHGLAGVAAHFEDVTVMQTLLGESIQSAVPFYEKETASSVLPETEREDQPSSFLPMTTLDELLDEHHFQCVDLLKLDVQGYELDVLRGGERTLAVTDACLVEVNLIPVHSGAPLLHQVVAFMAERRFRAYDISSLYRRPYDNALWQVDMMFVRMDSPLIASNRWE